MESDQVISKSDGGAEGRETEGSSVRDLFSEAARKFSQQFKSQAMSILSDEKNNITGQLETFAQALNQAGEKLREQNGSAAKLAETGAEGIEKFANRLRQSDLNALLDQAEDFARRRPGIVAGVALAAGFVFGQVLADFGAKWSERPKILRRKTESSLEYHPQENEEAYYERH